MVPRAVTALVGLALLGGQACAHGEALADPRAPVLALIDGDLAAMVADPQSAAGLTTLAVRTTSMGPTVGAGDLVVVDRSAYAAAPPARGDVVAFRMTHPRPPCAGSAAAASR